MLRFQGKNKAKLICTQNNTKFNLRLSTIELFAIKHKHKSTYSGFLGKKKHLNTFAFWFVPENLYQNPQKHKTYVRILRKNPSKTDLYAK